MTTRLDANEFQEELQRLDQMLHEAEASADPAARVRLQEIVQAVLHLHGVGLERLLESWHSFPSSTVTMKQSVEEAVFARAPEITTVEVEGLETGEPAAGLRVALPIVAGG